MILGLLNYKFLIGKIDFIGLKVKRKLTCNILIKYFWENWK